MTLFVDVGKLNTEGNRNKEKYDSKNRVQQVKRMRSHHCQQYCRQKEINNDPPNV